MTDDLDSLFDKMSQTQLMNLRDALEADSGVKAVEQAESYVRTWTFKPTPSGNIETSKFTDYSASGDESVFIERIDSAEFDDDAPHCDKCGAQFRRNPVTQDPTPPVTAVCSDCCTTADKENAGTTFIGKAR